ncbi:hypothetical protein HDV02_003046 [Globomyces sp. JEL0801]|nr:hypothetical protein HDV02_003046 [Globomyces sp. JEL0801]
MNCWIQFLSLVLLCSGLSTTGTKKIKIGISLGFPPEGSNVLDGAQATFLRIKQLNENSPLLGDDVALEPVFLNHRVTRDVTIINSLELQKQGVLAVVGSGFSSLSMLTSLVLQNYKIPQCCGASTNPSLSDKKQYPNFFRVIPTDASQTAAMMGYVVASGWKKIAIIHTNEDYGGGLANYLTNLARDNSVEVLAKVNVKIGVSDVEAKPAVQTVQESGARIIFFFGYNEELLVVLKLAKQLGIYGKDFVWFGADSLFDFAAAYPNDGSIYNGFLVFYPVEASGPEAIPFADYWKANREISGFPNISMTAPEATKSYVYFFPSCVDLFLHGFDALLKSNTSFTIDDLISGSLNKLMKVPDSFVFPEVATPSGYVRTDKNGDRLGDFDIYNLLADGSRQLVGGWTGGRKVLNPNTPIIYPGGSQLQPKDGIDPNDVALYAVPGTGLAVLSIVLAIIGTIFTLVSVLGVLKYRRVGAIKKSGVIIGFGMQLCLLLLNIQFLIMIDKPTISKCSIDAFVIPILFSFYYGLLFAKNLRIYRIFYKPPNRFQLSDTFIYFNGLLIALPSVIVSMVWVIADPPVPTIVKVSITQYYWTCKSTNGLESTAIAFHIAINTLVLLANLVMAFMTRNVVSTYSETKAIASSVYNMTVISLFTIVVLSSDSLGFQAKYIIKSTAIIYILLFNVSSNFLYKIFVSISDTGKNGSINSNGSKTGANSNTSNTATHNKTGRTRCEALLTTVSRFGLKYTRNVILCEITPQSIGIFDVKRVSLESTATADLGVGVIWQVTKIKDFAMKPTDPLILRFSVEHTSYWIEFKTAEEMSLWTKYFEPWTYQTNSIKNESLVVASMQ